MPGIPCYPADILIPLDGDVELTLRGFGLDGVRSVLLAGIEAAIVGQSPGALTVRVPPLPALPAATRETGDIILASDHHQVGLSGAVAFAGRKYIRGDANQDDSVELPDAVYILQFLFLGGPPLECPEAGDANDDDVGRGRSRSRGPLRP